MSNYLFAKGNLEQLKYYEWDRSIVSFDFDGTLARIVRSPEQAHLSPETRRSLKKLSLRVPVSIISGRSLADLRSKVDLKGVELIGNHGLEGVWNRPSDLSQAARICSGWKSELESRGFPVEDKVYTLTVHYRGTSARAKQEIREAISSLRPGPRVIGGKFVYNLIPEGAPDKGKALLYLMAREGMKRSLYVGDDETDEDVFRIPGEKIFSVRVGRKEGSCARFYLRRQSEVDLLLNILYEYLTARN